MRLESVKGVSKEDADFLRSHHGIDFAEDLVTTSALEVTNLGLDPDVTANAVKEVEYGEKFMNPREVEYTCECGEEFTSKANLKPHIDERRCDAADASLYPWCWTE
jgi:hypothetical protein